jgi:hypothetical protein
MACKKCGSAAQRSFPSDHTVNFPGIARLKVSPVYISQDLLVCLDCGFSEMAIPTAELDQLNRGMGRSPSKSGK